jgi:hypothetical protein
MIVKTETIAGRHFEIHENPSGHRRYWVTIDQHALLQGGSLRTRLFTTAEAARAAALKEVTVPVDQQEGARVRRKARTDRKGPDDRKGSDGVPGYSNFGGGGPFAPMGSPKRGST